MNLNLVNRLNPNSNLEKRGRLTQMGHPQPKFGWFSHGHHAIDKGAIFRLNPEDDKIVTWKDYLLRHWKQIEAANDMQDTLYDGPAHYINLKERGNPERPEGVPFRRSIQDVITALSPDALSQVEASWLDNPIDEEVLQEEETVFSTVLEAYDTVKKQLMQIAQGTKRLDQVVQGESEEQERETRKAYYQELSQNIGALTHYLADLFMPFHVSNGIADWELWPKHNEGIHLFTEGKVLKKSDLQNLVAQAQQKESIPLPHLSRQALPAFLISKMKDTYRKLHELAALHIATLREYDFDQTQDQDQALGEGRKIEFIETYSQRVKNLLEQQIREAQEAVSTVLRSVWVESGRPSIAQLEPEAVTEGLSSETDQNATSQNDTSVVSPAGSEPNKSKPPRVTSSQSILLQS
jgi:hypothetical protein